MNKRDSAIEKLYRTLEKKENTPNNLQIIMKDKGITIRKLANVLGKSNFRTGQNILKYRFSLKEALLISKFLNLTIEEMFSDYQKVAGEIFSQ